MGSDHLEALIQSNPEIIILGDSNYGITPESVIDSTGLGCPIAFEK
jgi:hypothetical protein